MTTNIVVPTNPSDLSKIKQALKNASDCLVRIEGEKEELKAIAEMIQEDVNIPKPVFNKMVKTYHKQEYEKIVADVEDFQALYEAVQSAK